MAGTSGDGSGVDTEVEFCLAKLTPDGRCTNGIVRIQSTLTNHLTYQRAQLKNLSYWYKPNQCPSSCEQVLPVDPAATVPILPK